MSSDESQYSSLLPAAFIFQPCLFKHMIIEDCLVFLLFRLQIQFRFLLLWR